ncbi:MAG: sugar ABC transporter ATP-binding protein [Oscillospiraceae bacterium]|jgi:ABC-type sugar transport system ATPase subunit|nr:sugar ABC transporter ATP-binding protein [Oscillospiraceae bacterium]
MSEYRLEMKGIVKEFLSMRALDNADFRLKEGEVHALLGINGAGKSTMIKVLSGVYQKDSGKIFIDGRELEIGNPADAIKAGISTVYQDPQVVPSFTGYENIYLGAENNKKTFFSALNRKAMREKAKKLLEEFPLDVDIDKPVYLLSAIEREIIAVLRALSKRSNILILDEPTSILTEKERQILFDLVRLLKSKGVSIIYITHHLDEVSEICDAMTIFRNGQTVASLPVEKGKVETEQIAELMLGKKLTALYPPKAEEPGTEVLFEARDLNLGGKFEHISFAAKRGEIYGIFGLVGSGIDEISKVLYGAMYKSSGELLAHGRRLALRSTAQALKNGIFLVPGDRKAEGQIGDMPITMNLTIAKMQRIVNRLGLVRRRKENALSEEMVQKLSIATPSIQKKVGELSGGNQQKTVIGKGLFTEADIYIFTEPTVGVDVGAKSGIYEIMRELSKTAAVIIISSDCEEVFGMADRAQVIYKGKCTFESETRLTTLHQMLVHAVSFEAPAGRAV